MNTRVIVWVTLVLPSLGCHSLFKPILGVFLYEPRHDGLGEEKGVYSKRGVKIEGYLAEAVIEDLVEEDIRGLHETCGLVSKEELDSKFRVPEPVKIFESSLHGN